MGNEESFHEYKQLNWKGRGLFLKWNTSALHAYKFAAKGSSVIRIFGDNSLYQIVGQQNLQDKQAVIFSCQIKKYGQPNSWIGIGVLTQNMKEKQWSNWNEPQIASYWVDHNKKYGQIWVNGIRKVDWTPSLYLRETETILMRVNLKIQQISWRISRQRNHYIYHLTSQFNKQKVYLFLAMRSNGDQISILKEQ